VLEVELLSQVPFVQHEHGRAAALHRQFRDPKVLRREPGAGVADDERDLGALRGAP
jgi:hypothetical protein